MKTRNSSSPAGLISSGYKGPRGKHLGFVDDCLEVVLQDGRSLRVPLSWYPRLERATERQRLNFEWIGRGIGIHWPDIDEDLSIEGLLRGNKAPRSRAYLSGRWSEELEGKIKEIEASYLKPAQRRARRVTKEASKRPSPSRAS